MASFSLSVQVILLSTAVVSIALLLKVSVPLVLEFSSSQAPLLWASLASWLKPPYLYLLINCIIITIAATSRFHHHAHAHDATDDNHQQQQMPPPVEMISSEGLRRADEFAYPPADEDVEYKPVVEENDGVFVDKSVAEEEVEVSSGSVEVDEFVISRSSWIPPNRMDSSEISPDILFPAEKPLVSSRFGHRKPLKAGPEGGRALRVARSKRNETLENTWKMITEGRAMPLTRHLKKSDTWENHGRQIDVAAAPLDPSPVKKSETFKDRTNHQLPPASLSPASGGKLRKEPSLSQDDLNRRVEAFIKKFNEEMRLQRQESLNQYKEMVGHGSH